MESAVRFPAIALARDGRPEHESMLFSTGSVLNLQFRRGG
jgi:hypothetical protein